VIPNGKHLLTAQSRWESLAHNACRTESTKSICHFSSASFQWQTLHACTLWILAELRTANILSLIRLFHQYRLYDWHDAVILKLIPEEKEQPSHIKAKHVW